jgi:DNA-binding transcriptional MocR family regulator
VTEAAVEAIDRLVRFTIYEHFADSGRAPTLPQLAERAGVSNSEVESSLQRLAAAHAIVLAPGSLNIWMAHPYSAVPTAYPVRTSTRTYWANCAWDALGIPVILGEDAATSTNCAECGDPLQIAVRQGKLSTSEGVVHFLVPPRSFWENVGFT